MTELFEFEKPPNDTDLETPGSASPAWPTDQFLKGGTADSEINCIALHLFFFFLDINFIASDFRKLSTHPGHWNTLIRQVFIILMLTLHTYAYIYLRLLRLILNLFYWFIEKVPSTLTFPQEKPVLIWLKKSVNLPLSLLIENRQ